MKKLLFFLLLSNSFSVKSQENIQDLKEIKVNKFRLSKNSSKYYLLTKNEILNRQSEDIGDLIKSIPGITLKNYGGLGGLKTISARGINGTHSGIYVDGIKIQNQTTGQVDLSNLQANNIEELKFAYQNQDDKLHPVSSYFNSNNLFLNSFEGQFDEDTFQVRNANSIGSFGQKETYLGLKLVKNKHFISSSYKHRISNGNFPFYITNFQNKIKAIRTNNDLKEQHFNLNFGKTFKNNSKLKFQTIYNSSNKGLPGAIVLYNPVFNQRLINKSFTSNLNYFFQQQSKYAFRFYINNRYEELTYIDSSFLNNANFLRTNYFSYYIENGIILKQRIGANFVYYGIENEYSTLNFNNQNFNRINLKYLFNTTISFNNWKSDFLLGFQQIQDYQIVKTNSYFSFNPSLNFRTIKPNRILGEFILLYKRTMRMPTFSELYFNQFINYSLLPETSNQMSSTNFYTFESKQSKLNISFSTFCNFVENKIVATPSKNLFVWSIQNVGTAFIYGTEFLANYTYQIKNLKFNINSNYTFQKALNFNPDSPLYKQQLAYIPIHTINSYFGLEYKKIGISFNHYGISSRYTLNQNIEQNLISGFSIYDVNIFLSKNINKHTLRVSFSIKNLFNSSYEYIRNFAMPGRNYLLNFTYSLH